MYRATIHTDGNADVILNSFASEDKKMASRSTYTVKKDKQGVVFTVEAQDSTALRAHLTTITKMLSVIESMERVK